MRSWSRSRRGATTYTEEQSRRNFERVSRLVVPGEPLKSILLTNPLAQEAGGSHWHGGGKHWHVARQPRMADARRLGADAQRPAPSAAEVRR